MSDCFIRFPRKQWTMERMLRWLGVLTGERTKYVHSTLPGTQRIALYVGHVRIELETEHIILITEDEPTIAVLLAWVEGEYGS